ncbi:MAG: porin family protein [Proteobacteria bacterium]|nr:porin family protein [Pseudomonadota bacterium]
MRVIFLCGALALSAPVFAIDLLGFYAGAGVGRSALVQDYYQIDSHATAWKVLAGWRPLSILGVEAEYTDLGSKGVDTFAGTAHVDTKANATAVYAVGYLPMPFIDIYAKLGAARVKADTTEYNLCGGAPGCNESALNTNNDRTGVAWGAGLQYKWEHFAARLDYERFDGPQGDPSVLALEATLNF